MPFSLKHQGTLGGVFPAISSVLSVGSVLSPIVGLLNPLIGIFSALVTAQKFVLMLLMLPLMLPAMLSDAVISVVEAALSGLVAPLTAFKDMGGSAALSRFTYKGAVKDMPATLTTYFEAGIPEDTDGPTQDVLALMIVAAGSAALSGLDDLFGAAPDLPPPPDAPPAAPNEVNAAELNFIDRLPVLTWTNTQPPQEAYGVVLYDTVGNVAVKQDVVTEFGTSHTYRFVGVTIVPERPYRAELVHVSKGTVMATKEAQYTPAPAPVLPPVKAPPGQNNPIPAPASPDVTFDGRQAISVAFPSLDGLAQFVLNLEEPLDTLKATIRQTVGRASDQKAGIEMMIDGYSKWVDDLTAGVTKMQQAVEGFGRFGVHFEGAFQIGDVWVYKYDGPVGGLGAAMAELAAGLPGAAGPDQVIEARLIVAEEAAEKAVLSFLIGG